MNNLHSLLCHKTMEERRQGLFLMQSAQAHFWVYKDCSIDKHGTIHISFGALNEAILEGFLAGE